MPVDIPEPPKKQPHPLEKKIKRVLENKVWIEPEDKLDDEFQETGRKALPGGMIELPDNYEDKQNKTRVGRIVAVGEGWVDPNGIHHPVNVSPGERVLFMKYRGQDATVDGYKCVVVLYNEILAVLHDDEKVDLADV